MRILEWSDTQITYHITVESQSWDYEEVDLTEYDKILLEIEYRKGGVVEYEWTVDSEKNSYVVFDIFSEATEWKSWPIKADIWWVKDWVKKIRFNSETIKWEVWASVKIPDLTVNE